MTFAGDLASAKATFCGANACWTGPVFSDGGITIDLGAHWRAFLIESHFQRQACVGRDRKGGYCDAIGVHDQSTTQVRVIELKTSGSFASARPQLAKGAEFVIEKGVGPGTKIVAEVHCGPAPKTSVRKVSPLKVKGRTIPVRRIPHA